MQNCYAVLLLICSVIHLFGAASSSSPELERCCNAKAFMKSLEPAVVEMALIHLPQGVAAFAQRVEGGISNDTVLFSGPQGMGKKTAALSIGQRYLPEDDRHQIDWPSFFSARTEHGTIDINKFERETSHIIARAQASRQLVVLCALDQVLAQTQEHQWLNTYLQTKLRELQSKSNIITIGLCRQPEKISEPIRSCFFNRNDYNFDILSPAFRLALIDYHLARSGARYAISREVRDEIAHIDYVYTNYVSASEVERLIARARLIAFDRNHLGEIRAEDIIDAFGGPKLLSPAGLKMMGKAYLEILNQSAQSPYLFMVVAGAPITLLWGGYELVKYIGSEFAKP